MNVKYPEKLTVGDLIEALKQFPSDLMVVTDGYEDEYELVRSPEILQVIYKSSNPYYYGEYAESNAEQKDSFPVVCLKRNRRDVPIKE